MRLKHFGGIIQPTAVRIGVALVGVEDQHLVAIQQPIAIRVGIAVVGLAVAIAV